MILVDVCLFVVGLALFTARRELDSRKRVPVRVRARDRRQPRR